MPSVDVDLVKQRNPIERVIASHGVKLQQSGERFTGCCPFHEEEHPSLVVYPNTRSFFCFGCKASGDVIDFVRRSASGAPWSCWVKGLRKVCPGATTSVGRRRPSLP